MSQKQESRKEYKLRKEREKAGKSIAPTLVFDLTGELDSVTDARGNTIVITAEEKAKYIYVDPRFYHTVEDGRDYYYDKTEYDQGENGVMIKKELEEAPRVPPNSAAGATPVIGAVRTTFSGAAYVPHVRQIQNKSQNKIQKVSPPAYEGEFDLFSDYSEGSVGTPEIEDNAGRFSPGIGINHGPAEEAQAIVGNKRVATVQAPTTGDYVMATRMQGEIDLQRNRQIVSANELVLDLNSGAQTNYTANRRPVTNNLYDPLRLRPSAVALAYNAEDFMDTVDVDEFATGATMIGTTKTKPSATTKASKAKIVKPSKVPKVDATGGVLTKWPKPAPIMLAVPQNAAGVKGPDMALDPNVSFIVDQDREGAYKFRIPEEFTRGKFPRIVPDKVFKRLKSLGHIQSHYQMADSDYQYENFWYSIGQGGMRVWIFEPNIDLHPFNKTFDAAVERGKNMYQQRSFRSDTERLVGKVRAGPMVKRVRNQHDQKKYEITHAHKESFNRPGEAGYHGARPVLIKELRKREYHKDQARVTLAAQKVPLGVTHSEVYGSLQKMKALSKTGLEQKAGASLYNDQPSKMMNLIGGTIYAAYAEDPRFKKDYIKPVVLTREEERALREKTIINSEQEDDLADFFGL